MESSSIEVRREETQRENLKLKELVLLKEGVLKQIEGTELPLNQG